MQPIKKLAIISSHPIQYNAPLFKLLAARGNVLIRVFYSWGETVLEKKYDPGFGKVVDWDIPLLDGYEFEFLENTAADKGTHHFKGIDNPDSIKVIKEYAPDAILIYGWAFKGHLRLIRYFHGKIPILFRGDSTLLDDRRGIKAIIRKIFLTWIYSKVDFALYVGTNNFLYFKQAGLRDGHLIRSPHAVDNTRFYRNAEFIEQALLFRKQLDIPPEAFVYVFAGKLESKKDPVLLLNAFITSGLSELSHLVFVGNGHLEKELQQRAKNFKNVHFMDFQNQTRMPSVYSMGDVFVLPSRGPGETWGLALNESMAGGSVVIASDKCGGAIDLISPGVNGYIFKAGELTDLAEKMLAVFNDKDRMASMKEASIKKIGEFSFEKVAIAIEDVMFSLPGNRDEVREAGR